MLRSQNLTTLDLLDALHQSRQLLFGECGKRQRNVFKVRRQNLRGNLFLGAAGALRGQLKFVFQMLGNLQVLV